MSFVRVVVIFTIFFATVNFAQVYLDSTATVDARVNDLLGRMSIEEKVGQMIQVDRGSIVANKSHITSYFIGSLLSGGGSSPNPNTATAWADMYDDFQSYALKSRLKIPIIYGIDAVHGHNNVYGATIFPHNIGMGATRNTQLVRAADSVIALEISATGIDWTFAPCVAVPQDERWGRTYEGFSETPELTVAMSNASVLGFQGTNLNEFGRVLACAKHFIGDGGTSKGVNEGNTEISEAELRRIHLPGYIEAINQGVGSIMATYNSWNGVKVHGYKYLLTDLLKGELKFSGFIVSDWAGIDQIPGDYRSDIKTSINAGIDMVMIPDRYQLFYTTLLDLLAKNEVSIERVNDAVARILRKKFEMGLFERPFTNRSLLPKVGSPEHRALARQSVRESMVLLTKKDDILPLKKSGQNILVAGKSANDIGLQCGGWTISWYGSAGNTTIGTTVYQALQQVSGSSVTYDRFGNATTGKDIAVVVIGETPYAETKGDKTDLALDPEDIAVVKKVKSAGLKTIVILFSGRPMIINTILPYSDAIIAAWLPGSEGNGIADVLYGDFQPTGKLSHTWPESMEQIPINFGDANYKPLFPYGHGISSLANSSIGSAPVYYGSNVGDSSTIITVSFNKPIKVEGIIPTEFTIQVNGNPVTIKSVSSNKLDNTSINIELSAPIESTDKVTISYSGSSVKAIDGGVLELFLSKTVLNSSSKSKVLAIPGTIQAEEYSQMLGVQTESTTDVGGGTNVGWIDDNDWMEYNVAISLSGDYVLAYRIASQSASGNLRFELDGTPIDSISLPITGGWQTWRTVNQFISLPAGNHTVRLYAKTGGFNMNWFSLTSLTSNEGSENPGEYILGQNYPNPFNPSTKISFTLPKTTHVFLELFNHLGELIGILINKELAAGTHNFDFDTNNFFHSFSTGIYFYRLSTNEFSQTKKMLLLK